MKDTDPIESFPAVRRQIGYEDPPDMLFFDVDEDSEEADFISVDDLFHMSPEGADEAEIHPERQIPLRGVTSFTLITAKRYRFINGRLSRLIRRSLAVTAKNENVSLLQTRVRPLFIQWRIDLPEGADAYGLITEFRLNLERDMLPYREEDDKNGLFWADDCLIQSGEKELTNTEMVRFLNYYQKD